MYGVLLLNFLEWTGVIFWVLVVIVILFLVWAFRNAECEPIDTND